MQDVQDVSRPRYIHVPFFLVCTLAELETLSTLSENEKMKMKMKMEKEKEKEKRKKNVLRCDPV